MARAYGKAEIIVAKQRHGSTGKVRVKLRRADHQVQRLQSMKATCPRCAAENEMMRS